MLLRGLPVPTLSAQGHTVYASVSEGPGSRTCFQVPEASSRGFFIFPNYLRHWTSAVVDVLHTGNVTWLVTLETEAFAPS